MIKVEVLCYSEEAIIEFHTLVNEIKDSYSFTYVRLMGDNIDNALCTEKVKVGEKGF